MRNFEVRGSLDERRRRPMPARIPINIDSRRLVGVHAEHVSNVSSKDFPGHYPKEDNSWDLERFKQVRCSQA